MNEIYTKIELPPELEQKRDLVLKKHAKLNILIKNEVAGGKKLTDEITKLMDEVLKLFVEFKASKVEYYFKNYSLTDESHQELVNSEVESSIMYSMALNRGLDFESVMKFKKVYMNLSESYLYKIQAVESILKNINDKNYGLQQRIELINDYMIYYKYYFFYKKVLQKIEKVIQKDKYYVSKYNITYFEVYQRYKQNEEKCECCNTKMTEKQLVVDHNHTNNIIRGIICSDCNKLLGFSKGSITRLENAKKYTKKNGADHSLSTQTTFDEIWKKYT